MRDNLLFGENDFSETRLDKKEKPSFFFRFLVLAFTAFSMNRKGGISLFCTNRASKSYLWVSCLDKILILS